jgi:hypothetical protein
MSRWLRLAAAAAALVLLIGAGCKKNNSAPEIPSIQGPNSARPGDTLTFRFSTTDPDGDSVSYMVSWAQGESTPWSPPESSGAEYTVTHVYPDSGTYYVKAKAKDTKDLETDWTDSLRVRVGSFPPDAPSLPQGPTSCSTGVAYTFKTRANHPLNDSVSIQFYWGFGPGDTSGWGPMVKSNTYYEEMHTWSLPGTYKVAARARDAAGFKSPWSESLAVTVDTAHGTPRGAPHGLTLTAPTDSTVKVSWFAPADSSVPLRYLLSFKETGASNFDSIGDTTGLAFVHDPRHRTGQYTVTAIYDTNRVTSTEAPSTAPVLNTLRWIPELSSAGDTGYWWNRTTGQAFLYTMDTLADVDSVDFYITDFAAGFAGPTYSVASPDTAQFDPGGHIPTGYWHTTWFSHLDSTATDDSILPRFITSRYRHASLLDSLPRLVACYTWDSHYALLDVQDVDTVAGEAYIRTWFQLIPNLRLIEHY